MLEMQHLRQMHCTMWLEAVREIISAEDSEIKFIISDHGVTSYHPDCPPGHEYLHKDAPKTEPGPRDGCPCGSGTTYGDCCRDMEPGADARSQVISSDLERSVDGKFRNFEPH